MKTKSLHVWVLEIKPPTYDWEIMTFYRTRYQTRKAKKNWEENNANCKFRIRKYIPMEQ